MKITTTTVLAAVAAAGAVLAAPIASADPTTQTIGQQAQLVNGDVIQGWTISALAPSTDVIPYAATGTLWEATATNEAIAGSVIPIISNLNARAADGQTYRSLFGVATAQGINPGTLAAGEKTTGKVYFDVTGAVPDSVVYNAGGEDLLVWVKPAPVVAGSAPSGSTPVATAPAAAAATPAPAAVGSQGTPLPAGSQGTPIVEGTPLPAGSQGTPIVEGTEPTAVEAATPTPTPAPAGGTEQGTPHGPQPAASPTPTPTPTPTPHGPPAS